MAASERFGSEDATHLVVLVHGLWGQPGHMHVIAEQLRSVHGDEKLRILIPSTNKFYNTYDGVEVGGERVAAEIEAELAAGRERGHTFRRFSMVGYSLGGLIARYCIGLLFARGHFEPGRLEAVNFTTFASPWMGVPSPMRFLGLNLWNWFGSRVLSTSGQQLFLADRFRHVGRPLLVVLADPSSIFMKALATFKNRVLYSNIVNDRSVPFNTSCLVLQDPFAGGGVAERDISYVPGYAPTIVDISQPVSLRPDAAKQRDLYTAIVDKAYSWLTRLPLLVLIVALLPVTSTFFLANAGVQNVRSGARIRSHYGPGHPFADDYSVPLLLEQALEAAAGVSSAASAMADDADADGNADGDDSKSTGQMALQRRREVLAKQSGLMTDTPTMDLMPEQLEIIRNVNSLGIRKYPVHIQLVTHTHAAIIVRWKKDSFKEGYAVLKHWLDQEFEV